MFSTRSYALAAALLLTPAAYGWAEGVADDMWNIWTEPEDYIEYSGRVSGYVENITFADPPPPRHEYPPSNLTREQLVEGHTTFVTLQRTPKAIEREGNVNITGYLNCQYGVDANTSFLLGFVPVPRTINHAWVDCGNGARVVITPGLAATQSASPLTPTGTYIPCETPDGQQGYAEELVFTANEALPDGTLMAREYHAWATPVMTTWTHHDGTTKNFWMPLPRDKLEAMGIHEFHAQLETDLP
jgi:hypothetical protein